MELEVIHIFNNKRRRYVETLNILLFEASAMVTVTKKLLTFLIDVYDGINFTIIVKLIQIRTDMTDEIKFRI